MIIQVEQPFENPKKELFWVRINLKSDDGSKASQILALATMEFLADFYRIPGNQIVSFTEVNKWINDFVLKKWEKLKDTIFDQATHYDVYANSSEGESRGLNFLIREAK